MNLDNRVNSIDEHGRWLDWHVYIDGYTAIVGSNHLASVFMHEITIYTKEYKACDVIISIATGENFTDQPRMMHRMQHWH